MTEPRIMLATLTLNGMEWLSKLVEQHIGWPGLVRWCFVEAADAVYAATSQDMVADGGSVDGTTRFLLQLHEADARVAFRQCGLVSHADPAQSKCLARNEYLEIADKVEPDFIVVLDDDEFVPRLHQESMNRIMGRVNVQTQGLCFRQRHMWRPTSVTNQPLFSQEVVGGYWSIPHCRVWRWVKGMRHVDDHNTPEADGRKLRIRRYDQHPDNPYLCHLGFASSLKGRKAKHAYYVARGEGKTDGRQVSVDCRAAWETWKPGDQLPHGGRVVGYDGDVPEIFLNH